MMNNNVCRGLKCSISAGVVLCWLVMGGLLSSSDASQFAAAHGHIIDSAGRRIETAKPFQRIISLYGAHTENLFAMNAQERLIGVTRNEDWPPEASAKPVFSYHDDLEKFLVARPDLVLIRPMIDRGYARLIKQLEQHGIVVVSLQPGTINEMYVYWRILGTLAGCKAEAERMIEVFKETIGCMAQRTAALPVKKRVYFEAIHDRMRTFSPGSMPIFALEAAGGVNVAADARSRRGTNIADYGKERILSHAESIDVYLAQVGPMNRPSIETLKNEPGYSLLKAVRENQVYLIDERLVARPTMRMLKGIERINRFLYPDFFTDKTLSTVCLPPDEKAGFGPKQKEEIQ